MVRWLPLLATDEGFMTRRCRRLGIVAWLVVASSLSLPNEGKAQSAADKSTARQLATDGIQLYRQDRFADALDKLERAESLFDAPVHLLYIARCQVKVNRLVEAAESYRRLIRSELSAQAPQTFKDAVADGQKELPAVEPKVPSLRVEVVPANARDLRLSIDGEAVSTAVLGVDRPINPGSHVVEVTAKGQAPILRKIDVAVGSKQVVKLELQLQSAPIVADTPAPSTGDVPATGTAPDGAAGSGSGNAHHAGVSTSRAGDAGRSEPESTIPSRLKIIAAIDVVGAVPITGKIDAQARTQTGTGVADDRSIEGRFGPGGGLEIRAGLSIPAGKVALTPFLFGGANSHAPGSLYKTSADQSFGLSNSVNSVMTAEPTSVSMGFGVRADSAPESPFGIGILFELGFVARQTYTTKGTWTITQTIGEWAQGNKCDFTEEFNGVGMRMRGGALMPVSRVVTFVGTAGVTVARISSAGLTSKTCDPASLATGFRVVEKGDVPAADRRYHAVFGISLGAEFGLGLGH